MAICSLRPIPLCLGNARKIRTMALSPSINSALQKPVSESLGSILTELVKKTTPSEPKQQMQAELLGSAVVGVLSQDAKPYKQPVMGLMTSLQDENDPDLNLKLVINNFTCSSTSDEEAQLWFPKDARVRIVEPCVLLAGGRGMAIMVDNPAAVQILGVQINATTGDPGRDFWTAGNIAFARGEYLRAAHFYRECIERGCQEPLLAFLRSGKSWLKLGIYEKALASAELALALSPGHFQSLFVKAQALAGMQEYRRAVECFWEAERVGPKKKNEVIAARERCRALDEQSRTGVYDLKMFLLSGRTPEAAPESSDFVGPARLGVSEGKGRGLFATKHLRPGELVLVSNSVARSHERGQEFHAKVGRACMSDRRVISRLRAFFDPGEMFDMDLFLPNREWYSRNSDHLVPSSSYKDLFKEMGKRNGLCPLATMINHSCTPNVSRQPVGGALFVRASREICEGEELVTCYFDPFQPLENRRKQAGERNFEFVCSCERCKLEERINARKPGLAERYVNALQKTKNPQVSLLELVKVSSELEASLKDEDASTHVQKKWLIASYPYAFWAATFLCGKNKSERTGKLEELVAAFHETAPGHLTTMKKMVEMYNPQQNGASDGTQILAEHCSDQIRELLLREAVCCFGEQSSNVLQAIVENPAAGAAAGDLSF